MTSGEICVTWVAPATRKDWDETMHIFYSSLPIILYVAALILGFFGVRLPGGAGGEDCVRISPTIMPNR